MPFPVECIYTTQKWGTGEERENKDVEIAVAGGGGTQYKSGGGAKGRRRADKETEWWWKDNKIKGLSVNE